MTNKSKDKKVLQRMLATAVFAILILTEGNGALAKWPDKQMRQKEQMFNRIYVDAEKSTLEEQRPAKAIATWEGIVSLAERIFGPNHPKTALSLGYLSYFYMRQGLYDKSETVLTKALTINRNAFGLNHPTTAVSTGNLGYVFVRKGLYSKAESLYRESLSILQRTMGPSHPSTATALGDLASLYHKRGDYVKAEALFRQSLAIRIKSQGSDHPHTATVMNNLALLYIDKGEYKKASDLLHQVWETRRKTLGKDHPDMANIANSIGLIYYLGERYKQAAEMFEIALKSRRTHLGHEHPVIAESLINLGSAYEGQGMYQKAGQMFEEAVSIAKSSLGDIHPRVVLALNNLAMLYSGQEQFGKAEALFRANIETEATILQRETSYLPRSQRAAFVQSLGSASQTVYSFANNSPSSANLALFSRLNRHGLLEQIEKRQAQLAALPGGQQAVAEELRALTRRLSSTLIPAEQRTVLRARQEELERQLYRRLPELKPRVVEVEQLAAVMPAGSALVEFQRYQPFDGRQRARQRWGQPRYLALILKPDRSVRSVDLGPAAPIDQLIQQALKASEQNQQDATSLWAQVSRVALAPLSTATNSVQVLFLSPDGELNRVPFAALPMDGGGKLLAEAVQLRLLTTGRDLLDLQQPAPAPRGAALVVANPSFDRLDRDMSVAKATRNGALSSQQRSADLANHRWKPLPATAAEGQAIASLTKGRLLMQEQASAAAVQQPSGPRVLHIASHAFFLPNQPQRADAGSPNKPLMFAADRSLPISGQIEENPLLRSGIALAGANTAPATAADDGYLMALEVAQLDWKGTELVVVSACESGKGEIRAGEGVYGLRRAIAVAGARSSLLSLWKVDDAATAEFMTRYYTRLKAGQGRADALAAVQSEFRKGTAVNGQWKDPYYWAAWQLVGDWGPIREL